MGVRLGINPLTWTIDDLPEVGGETRLETCLTEASAAGYRRRRARLQVPAHRAGTQGCARAARPRARLRLVQREPAGTRRRRRVRGDAPAPRTAVGARLRGRGGRRRRRAASTATAARDCRSGRVLAADDWPRFAERLEELGARLRGQRPRARLPSPHGHGRADRGRGGPADGRLRRDGRPAARHRAPDLRGRRSRARRDAPRRAHRARALQGRAPRGARRAASIATRVSSTPCWTACSRCRATAAWTIRRCSRRSRARTTAAGWSSRPNRTRASRRPAHYAEPRLPQSRGASPDSTPDDAHQPPAPRPARFGARGGARSGRSAPSPPRPAIRA